MAELLRGSEVVAALSRDLAPAVSALEARGVTPTLAIVRVGEREDAVSYERSATRRAREVGVRPRSMHLPSEVTTEGLMDAVTGLNRDDSVHGVLVLHPLPSHVDEHAVRNALAPEKDVDGITDLSLASVFTGGTTGFPPCTAAACLEMLDHYRITCEGRRAVVIGRSLVVGRPLAMMLLGRHATVDIAHSRTRDLPALVREADIVVACVGRARMIGGSCLSEGQVVMDVGINVAADGTLVGDVDFAAAQAKAAALTPVPGGVGTVTTSVLVKHVVAAAGKAEDACGR
ncbi:MAG: bifunctional 5,10-methylenetetrahydrofolate dehydrogenase/5,10-methenyltetrahydrofolate cyclohydrolase [Coriobacteriales bacterium]|jgi:methylenetetrahydrofolate dehydrogenase (NADP+)/methenyltetrahydrofolate cyclohydrolase|nr:bifunctional 5,10-methylenetetrahydrofolate dehydrogenase/5,10-methenyltetrahydrofolate cyclohydrolase [Coriobacteriales bacterium]